MAKNSNAKPAAPAFYEATLKGSPKAVRGLLAGLALGGGVEFDWWYHEDEDINPGDRSGSVRQAAERLHLMPVSEVRVVLGADLAKQLRSAARKLSECGIAEVVSVKRIKQARVEVRYHTYARRYDDEVQILLQDLPRGVKLAESERQVETDEEARGVEAYTAVHHFESTGSGVLVGRFDLVLDLRNRLDVHPLIDCGAVDLVLA